MPWPDAMNGTVHPDHRLLFRHRPRRRAWAERARLAGLRDLPQAGDCARLAGEGLESLPARPRRPRQHRRRRSAEVLAAPAARSTRSTTTAPSPAPARSRICRAARWRRSFETNLFGIHDLTRRVIPVMRAQGHGRIVNCSSVLGLVGCKWRGAYVATKFALEGLTDVLRLEMRDTPHQVHPDRTRARHLAHPRKRHPAFRALDRLAKPRPRRAIPRRAAQRLYESDGPGPVRTAARAP